MAFWTEPQMASIHKMLNPRSIAIVGATPRMQYGGRFLAAALKAKDRVRVYAVNPRYDEIMGEKSYPSVTDLPEAPDVVAVVVPWDQVLDVLQESHRKGAGSAIVISAGFAERGRGRPARFAGGIGRICPRLGHAYQRPQLPGAGECQRRHLGHRFLARGLRADRADWPGVPKRRDGVRAVPGARGGERHRLQLHHLDRERGRPRLHGFRPLSAGRSGYTGHCRLCRRLQAGRQISRSGKARSRARQADRPH